MSSEPDKDPSPSFPYDNQEDARHQPISYLPSTDTSAPSRVEVIKGENEKTEKKLRLAEATASPSSLAGYPRTGGNHASSKGTTRTELRLAQGAAAAVGGNIDKDAPKAKKDTANRVRLASGHHHHQQDPTEQEAKPETNNEDLVEAEQVEDVEALLDQRIQNMPVAVASEDNNREIEKKQATTKRIFIFLFAAAVFVSVAVGAILLTNSSNDGTTPQGVISNDPNTPEPSAIPTVSPTVPPEPTSAPTSFLPWIKGVLEPYIEDTAPWDDPTSSQFEALEWMGRDREFWLPAMLRSDDHGAEEQLLERYVVLAISMHFTWQEYERSALSLLTSLHACDWKIGFFGIVRGFDCGGSDGNRITSFSWNDLAANNTIPTEIGLLSSLQVFEINNNDLFGTIPSVIFRLPSLRTVGLANNRLSGTLGEVSTVSLLEVLDLSGNSLSGTIPLSYGEMTNLRSLYLQNNAALSGVLPASFANLRELTNLRVSGTLLTGGMEEVICGANASSASLSLMQQFEILVADCAGSPPKVECCCCTSCCGNGLQNDQCSI